jgi:uncharacterized protein YjiS (DUF1127 family)
MTMILTAIIRAAFNAAKHWLRGRVHSDLLALNDHALADIGLRRADLRAGLWQPTGMVDGDPLTTSTAAPPPVFNVFEHSLF